MPYQRRWLAMAVVVVAGCGVSGPPPVGSVEGVLSPDVLVNGVTAAAGDAIPGGATLSTDDSGVLDFLLRGFVTSCQLRPDSRIVVRATRQVTLRYERGAVWCQSSTTPDQEVVVDVGTRKIRTTNARFGLRDGNLVVDSGDATVIDPTSAVPEYLVRAAHSCQLDTVALACGSYAADPAERQVLDDVQRTFVDTYPTSTGTAPTSGEPSGAPEPSTAPAERTTTPDPSEPTPETIEPTPEPDPTPSS